MQTRLCPKCAAKGIVAHRHITNKRNSKSCAVCEGKGEVPVTPPPCVGTIKKK